MFIGQLQSATVMKNVIMRKKKKKKRMDRNSKFLVGSSGCMQRDGLLFYFIF